MKEVAKKRKRGFAVGETDEVRKDDIRKKEEKREAKEMENRIKKVIWGRETNIRFMCRSQRIFLSLSLSLSLSLCLSISLSLSHTMLHTEAETISISFSLNQSFS